MQSIFRYFMLLITIGLSLITQANDIVIEKSTEEKNPSLAIIGWEGPQEALNNFAHLLRFADWFDIVTTKEADYKLTGVYDGKELKLNVESPNRTYVLKHANQNQNYLFQYLIDSLLHAEFKTGPYLTKKIAFVGQSGVVKEIFIAEVDGRNAVRQTKHNHLATEPHWGGAGRFLSYTRYLRTRVDIKVLDLNLNRSKRLASYQGLNAGCQVDPSGTYAVMTLSKGKQVDLYVKNIHNGQMKQLTNDRLPEASACWSPDSGKILFVGSYSSRPGLYTIPLSGGRPTKVMAGAYEATSPDWSVVSNKVCFSLRYGGQYVIASLDMTKPSAGFKIHTSTAGDWESPSWMGDGRHVLCSRYFNGKKKLYLVDTKFEKQIPLPTNIQASLPDAQ